MQGRGKVGVDECGTSVVFPDVAAADSVQAGIPTGCATLCPNSVRLN